MATLDNLKAAFAGESQANRKYLAFAKKAEADGFPMIAKLFRGAAEAETVHAHAHFHAMEGVKGTGDNLRAAIEGEAYEYKEMYPGFLKTAEEEGHRKATMSFRNALAVEKTHHDLYAKALASFDSGRDLTAASIFICPVCGHTEIGGAPDKCPVCNAAKEKFFEVK